MPIYQFMDCRAPQVPRREEKAKRYSYYHLPETLIGKAWESRGSTAGGK